MAAIDWGNLYRATNKDNTPTPGWLFNEIVRNVSSAPTAEIPPVAEYLADCVDGDHAHVKLKALFVIKTLAYRIPPFCRCMQERIASVNAAAEFTGPPSAVFGDEPYRLVREAAEGAAEALAGEAFYHQEYKDISQRIVGFGNYQPDQDTLHPDGSVNLTRDVSFGDVVGTTIGIVGGSARAIFGGFRKLFSGSSQHVGGLELDAGIGEEDDEHDFQNNEPGHWEDQADPDDDGEYHPSAGTYVPPVVPMPSAQSAVETAEELEENRVQQDACFAAAVSLLDDPQEPDEDAILRVLGIAKS
eukprot:TRINITY_DN41846_c0_g1_i1.p1 TRINITY_DN41846_c0_g1~~TRINITY_DN41846_c0_g1_i1.p1  ORF type:complete len:301 (-),score=71.77 TRINITY_DN41846_c0_g1_i1:124-1026(-)